MLFVKTKEITDSVRFQKGGGGKRCKRGKSVNYGNNGNTRPLLT